MNGIVRRHLRLLMSSMFGAAVFFCLPPAWTVIDRVLVGWNTAVVSFLILIFTWMTGLSAERLRVKYAEEDESAQFILVLVVIAALLSVVAIIEPLASLKHVAANERGAHLLLAMSTLAGSWMLVPTVFTTHYADLFYSAGDEDRPLGFPETSMPAFWDFAYFSFTIAAACQTSDVTTRNSSIRKLVLAHSVISFFFNASILGFAINVTAGLLG